MTDIALRHTAAPVVTEETTYNQDPTGGRLIAWAQSLTAAHQLASALCRTSFVPKHFAGKPEEAAAALMLGDELGLSPISSLRSVFVIGGTPGLYAKTMVALVQSRGHDVWTEKDTPDKVIVAACRRGSDHVERSEWTTDRARRAGYTNNKKYETDPQAMLYARAASDVCRKIAADVLAGVPHTVEELELEGGTSTGGTRRTTTVRRATPTPPEPDLEHTEAPPASGVTPEQIRKMGTVMGKLGMTDRDSALAYVADIVGRAVESRNDLTKAEASLVIDALDRDDRPAEEPPLPADEPALPDPTLDPEWAQR